MTTSILLPLRHSKLNVELHVPKTAEDECLILQEPIATAVLQAFPRPYLLEKPMQTAMTLPCRHTFHAMALIYHWAQNPGTAQCCSRCAGPDLAARI